MAAPEGLAILVEALNRSLMENTKYLCDDQRLILRCVILYITSNHLLRLSGGHRTTLLTCMRAIAACVDFDRVAVAVCAREKCNDPFLPCLSGALYWHLLDQSGADLTMLPRPRQGAEQRCALCRVIGPVALFSPTVWAICGALVPLCDDCVNTVESVVPASGAPNCCAGCGMNRECRSRSNVGRVALFVCGECVP